MDPHRFDGFTRKLTTILDRRRFTGMLAALALALAGASAPTSAKKNQGNKKKKCKKGAIKCDKKCINPGTDPQHCGGCGNTCGPNQACVDGRCQGGSQPDVCPTNRVQCAALCVDLSSDEEHCGACGNACPDPLTCINGRCACAEDTQCGGDCVDLRDDDNHCGSCGNACAADKTCRGGACMSACDPECATGQQCINGRCTCRGNFDCADDPQGDWCVQPVPGHPTLNYCGCLSGDTVCTAGEGCSHCCDDLVCEIANPGLEIVCAEVPANSGWSRQCCIPLGGLCGTRPDWCCSEFASGNDHTATCVCAPTEAPCRHASGCCSGTCRTATGTCA